MIYAYIALLGRILLLGYERIVVKQLGQSANSLSGAFVFFSFASILLLPSFFFVRIPNEFAFLKIVLISGCVYSFAFWFYVKSLAKADASLVGPLYHFNIFFLLILAVIFLYETLTLLKVLGFILLIYGASFLNKQKNIWLSLKALFTNKHCLFMIVCSILMAIGRTIDGVMVQQVHPVIYAFCLYSCISLFLLLYQIPTRRFSQTLDLIKRKPGISIASGAVNAYSYLLLLIAFQKIEISIAEPVSMLGMIITVILARFILKEKIQDRWMGVLIMIAGGWLLLIQ